MRKLRLDLDDLSVESFETTPLPRTENGTVFGQEQCTCYTQCTCPGCPTCDASCNGTCAYTCEGTCAYTCAGDTCGLGCPLSYDGVCNTYFCV
jgi:hypothetical protein